MPVRNSRIRNQTAPQSLGGSNLLSAGGILLGDFSRGRAQWSILRAAKSFCGFWFAPTVTASPFDPDESFLGTHRAQPFLECVILREKIRCKLLNTNNLHSEWLELATL